LGYDIPAGATNLQILKNGAITFVGPGGKSRLEIAAPGKTAYKIGTVGAAAKATAAKTTAKVAAPIAKPKSQVIKKAVPAPVKQPSPPKLTRQKNKAQVKKNSF
jgi:hypothetical protein